MNEPGASRVVYRGAAFLVLSLIAALILHELIWVLVQVFVACIIASAITPVVNSIVGSERVKRLRRQPSRGLVAAIVFLLAAAITLVIGFLVVRAIARETQALTANLPGHMDAVKSWLASVVVAYPGIHEVDLDTWIALNMRLALDALPVAFDNLLNFLSLAGSLLGGFITVVMTVFMALYLTVDAPRMRDYLAVFWPSEHQQQICRMSNQMASRLGHWTVGQALLCLIVGGGAWLGLQLIGVPYAGLLGLIWTLAEFVPGIGPFLSAIPSIFFGFTVSPEVGVAAAVFTLVWSQVESNIITPRVMGNAVELHPLVVLVALVVGAELLGTAGALLAIPVSATLAVVIDEIRLQRMRDQLPLTLDGVGSTEALSNL